MGDSTRRNDRARRWELLLATVAGLILTVSLALALAIAVPPMLVNLSTEVSDGTKPFEISSRDGTAVTTAEITVPAGWVVQRKDDTLLVRTPDGVMNAVVEAVAEPAGEALEVASADRSPRETEVLASGLTVVHADLVRGAGVVAAVSCHRGEQPGATVVVTTRIRDGGDAEMYRPALAALLEGIA